MWKKIIYHLVSHLQATFDLKLSAILGKFFISESLNIHQNKI